MAKKRREEWDTDDEPVTVKEPVLSVTPPPVNRKPVPQDIRLSARQYVRARGKHWEQAAGFLHEMKCKHPGEKTRPEWDQLWDAFWARPVK